MRGEDAVGRQLACVAIVKTYSSALGWMARCSCRSSLAGSSTSCATPPTPRMAPQTNAVCGWDGLVATVGNNNKVVVRSHS